MMYFKRLIDKYLSEWASRGDHKPLLLRGARQVGKSSAVRNLGKSFYNFVEIDFERNPEYSAIFKSNRDVSRIISQISAISGQQITPGKTLVFLDEIQECPEAVMSLRYFREDLPELHIVAAGSLLEFALDELPTFGVARIHSMFMYPFTFDEFLEATGNSMLMNVRNEASPQNPLPDALHEKLCEMFRYYILIGGMPEVVAKWVETNDFLKCQEVQDDLILGFEDDFPKYRKRVKPELLRTVFRSAAMQVTKKFVYSRVGEGFKISEVKSALDLLYKSGLLIPVEFTSANGLPLGECDNNASTKVLIMDSGLLLRLQNLTLDNSRSKAAEILTESASELVNKGQLAEMIAGLELLRYQAPNIRHMMYYWTRQNKNAQAEIDYVTASEGAIIPIEVKAVTQGGMKSLWYFLRDKGLTLGVRTSLENFGELEYTDALDGGVTRHLCICPLYALSQLKSILALRYEI